MRCKFYKYDIMCVVPTLRKICYALQILACFYSVKFYPHPCSIVVRYKDLSYSYKVLRKYVGT